MKAVDYYVVEAVFKTKGDVQGFVPGKDGTVNHYRDEKGQPVLYHYHFKNWFRANLPLVNRASSIIGDLKFCDGEIQMKGGKMKIIEKYVTNIDSGFHSSSGTGGRGSKFVECLPEGALIKTSFLIPRELIPPNRFEEVLGLFGKYGSRFGGGAKLSTGCLIVENFKLVSNQLFVE